MSDLLYDLNYDGGCFFAAEDSGGTKDMTTVQQWGRRESIIWPPRFPWLGYLPLESKGYEHEVTFLKGKKKTPSELMPRVHLVISLLKRWLMGTHQGAVSHKHLDYYLDEFTFRFNRRRSKNRGKFFFRLAQQAVAVDPVTHHRIVHPDLRKAEGKPQSVGAW